MTQTRTEQIADSVTLRIVARFAMIFASCILLPIGAYLGNRMISASDALASRVGKLTEQVAEGNASNKLIRQQMLDWRAQRDVQLSGHKAIIDDHESRIRVLERPTRAN